MTPKIPNVFNFVFGLRQQTEPFHVMHYICLRSCLEVMRPDTIRFHYQHEPFGPLWDEIKPFLELVRIEPTNLAQDFAYTDSGIEAFRYAHISDFVRLEILVREGGFYADMDTLFLRPLPEALRRFPCVMGHEKPPSTATNQPSLCNAIIGAAPQSRFCQLWLEQMSDAFDGTWSNHSTLLPYRLSLDYPDHVHVEPEETFFALDWTRDGLADLFLRDRSLTPGSVSLHLWSHLWFDAGRRDFSPFNGNLLTIDYVAFAKTTYALNARRFLPSSAQPSYARYLRQRLVLAGHHVWMSAYGLTRSLYRWLRGRAPMVKQ